MKPVVDRIKEEFDGKAVFLSINVADKTNVATLKNLISDAGLEVKIAFPRAKFDAPVAMVRLGCDAWLCVRRPCAGQSIQNAFGRERLVPNLGAERL